MLADKLSFKSRWSLLKSSFVKILSHIRIEWLDRPKMPSVTCNEVDVVVLVIVVWVAAALFFHSPVHQWQALRVVLKIEKRISLDALVLSVA
ncbi:hypothetical protein CF64_09630 [Bradyrhizobium japonicum]|nr:hypothetical protein CF64_09630 [Bradyrhizobium japonicum]